MTPPTIVSTDLIDQDGNSVETPFGITRLRAAAEAASVT